MNKAYLLLYTDEFDNTLYLVFSCLDTAAFFASTNELDPFDSILVPMPVDDPYADLDYKYEWDGIKWKYAPV